MIKTQDRAGRNLVWIDCTQCSLGQLSNDSDESSREIRKISVDLDIAPFETKVFEGVIIPMEEQLVKVLIL